MAIDRDRLIIRVECEGCGELHPCFSAMNAKAARKEVNKLGWQYLSGTLELPSLYFNKGDFCSDCIKKAIEERKVKRHRWKLKKKVEDKTKKVWRYTIRIKGCL